MSKYASNAVEDYSGAIDGSGVKSVMFKPKTMVELIDPAFIEGIGEVLRFGAEKYAKNNWMRGMSFITVLGGVLRHTLAMLRGEDLDPETGLPHAHHAACGLMFFAHYRFGVKRDEYKAFDDRVYVTEGLDVVEDVPEPLEEKFSAAFLDEWLSCDKTHNLFQRRDLMNRTHRSYSTCAVVGCPACSVVRSNR